MLGNPTKEIVMTEKRKHRSPSYPYLDLEEAINRLKLIYDKDKRAATTIGAILEHMGYSTGGKEGKSGSGGRAVSALRQYGLIEEAAGKYKVSDDGFRILHLPSDSQERLALIRQAAIKPPLFQKTLEQFQYDLPSDTTLKSHLILAEGFNPDSVSAFIRTLWKTKEFANLGVSDYNQFYEDANAIDAEFVPVAEPMPSQEIERSIPMNRLTALANSATFEQPDYSFSYQLSFPRNIKAEVKIFGKDLRKQDIERLMKEVGDLAGAFDEEPSEMTQRPTEVEGTQ